MTRSKSCTLSAGEIARHVGGRIIGDASRLVSGVSSLEHAGPGDLVFADDRRWLTALSTTKAGVALVRPATACPASLVAIEVSHPAVAMARATELLHPRPRAACGVSPLAHVGERVAIGEGASVGPFATVNDDAVIGAGSEIGAGAVVGRHVTIGRDCVVHPRVVIYDGTAIGDRVILHAGVVLGADGFGYVRDTSENGEAFHRKVPQVGRVVIEDDVEIGANSAVDRAAFGETRIGRGTKIDNLVTVGHNSLVGRHCIIVGQAGLSGSTTLGDYVTIAGQVGVAGHLAIGDGAIVGAQAGVTKDVEAGAVVLGSPATDARRAKKALSILDTLPELRRRLVALERRLDEALPERAPAVKADED